MAMSDRSDSRTLRHVQLKKDGQRCKVGTQRGSKLRLKGNVVILKSGEEVGGV